jgi:hypothetical protein
MKKQGWVLLLIILSLTYGAAWNSLKTVWLNRAAVLKILQDQVAQKEQLCNEAQRKDYGLVTLKVRGKVQKFSYYITKFDQVTPGTFYNFVVRGPEADSGELLPFGFSILVRHSLP